MKKFFVFLLVLVVAVVGAAVSVDNEKIHKHVSTQMCKESLQIIATKPSSVEFNKITSISSDLDQNEIKEWISSQNYSDRVRNDVTSLAKRKAIKRIFVSIDFSANEKIVGSVRGKYLCKFAVDVFDYNIFEGITFGNKDFIANEILLNRDVPSRYDNKLSKIGVKTKLRTELTFKDKLLFVLTNPTNII